MEGIEKFGPWGGAGGMPFKMKPTPTSGRLSRIRIWYGEVIDAIQFGYTRIGTPNWSDKWGGRGGKLSEVVLQDDECLTFIFGHVGSYRSYRVIKSVILVSNRGIHGPFGDTRGEVFCLPRTTNGMIGGLYGKYCGFVDSLGVFTTPFQSIRGGSPGILQNSSIITNEEKIEKFGPWGGAGGKPFIMKQTSAGGRLARIRLWHGAVIDAIQFGYLLNGTLNWSKKWGGRGGKLSEIVLQDDECLTFIFGHFGSYSAYTVVKSVILVSNRGKHGPFGETNGKVFCLPYIRNCTIAGFFGKYGEFVDSLGVFMAPVRTVDPCTQEDKENPSILVANKEGESSDSLLHAAGDADIKPLHSEADPNIEPRILTYRKFYYRTTS